MNASLYTDWSIDPLLIARHPHRFNRDSKTVCIWSNSQSIIRPLDRIVGKVIHTHHTVSSLPFLLYSLTYCVVMMIIGI
jgi:hypothetical protein